MGAISWCSSLVGSLGEMSSGPDALFGESPCRSLSTPSIDIYIYRMVDFIVSDTSFCNFHTTRLPI